MNFSEQAEALTKNLADAQKQAWDAWVGMASGALGKRADAASLFDPSAWLKPAVDAENATREGVSGEMIDRLFAAQSNMMGVMDFLTKTWTTVAPNVEAGNPWQPDLQKYVKNWTDGLLATPEKWSATGSDMLGMFGSTMSELPAAMAPGLAMWKEMALTGHFTGGDSNVTSAVSRLMDMATEMHPALGGVGDMPRMGLTREKNAKFLRVADATMDVRKASTKYRVVMATALGKAAERTVEKLAALSKKGEKITSVRELSTLWYRTADATLIDTFNSLEFIEIQNEMSSAIMDFKTAQREVLEITLSAFDMPTRSEIDDAYKIIHDLKKEVRQLKRGTAVNKPAAPVAKSRQKAPAASKPKSRAKAKAKSKAATPAPAAKSKPRRRAKTAATKAGS